MIGAFTAPVGEFLLRLERLAAGAVVSGIGALVDIAGVVDRLDEFAAAGVVALLAGLDEVVERDVERVPDLLELPGHLVNVGFRLEVQFAGALRHLDRVLVVAHQEMDRGAFHPAEPGLHIGPDLLEGRADVRAAVGVVDRRRDVIAGFCVCHPHPRSRVAGRAALVRPREGADRVPGRYSVAPGPSAVRSPLPALPIPLR